MGSKEDRRRLFLMKVKEVDDTSVSSKLIDQLQVQTVFRIGSLEIKESVVVMWIVMAIMTVAMFLISKQLRVENPGKFQLGLESVMMKGYNFFYGIVGENGKGYIPYFLSLITFIAVSNLFPIIGFKPPTKDVNVTLGMAIITIVLVQVAGIRAKGVKGWGKSFSSPTIGMLPMNLLEIFLRPFSLTMRLMGNMLGGFAIMELLKMVVPVGVPAIASLYFDIFDGLIQAFVFVFLTAIYIGEAVETE